MRLNLKIFIVGVLTMGFLSSLFGFSKKAVDPKFTKLSKEDSAQLEKQRALISTEVKKRYGTLRLTKTKTDLPVLQHLLDDRVFTKTQTYELQCLGVVLGDVMASELPLKWVMITDEYGTDPTLRFKNTTVQINALTMISKRIEKGETVDVTLLLDMTRQQLAKFEKNGFKDWEKDKGPNK
jgi:hypothetical protein